MISTLLTLLITAPPNLPSLPDVASVKTAVQCDEPKLRSMGTGPPAQQFGRRVSRLDEQDSSSNRVREYVKRFQQ
jgi:hypothetical protein